MQRSERRRWITAEISTLELIDVEISTLAVDKNGNLHVRADRCRDLNALGG
jgi:hypothetical protein